MSKQEALPAGPEAGLVIVVGDWVIDEYWFLVQHHSRMASHTGLKHFRLGSESEQEIIDLCGAGHVARVLTKLRGGHDGYSLVGLGNWNEEDTETIAHLVHAHDNPDCPVNSPGFRLVRRCCTQRPDLTLLSLAPDGATIRVIRQYHRRHDGIEQLNRIDWEAPDQSGPELKIKALGLPKPAAGARVVIAVDDLRKGVVTKDVVRQLRDYYSSAIWCIRSKVLRPDWLDLVEDRIALLLLGPEIAAQLSPWGSWISHNSITLQALNILKELPGNNVVMVSDRKEIVARTGERCLIARSLSTLSSLTDLGFPTGVFAALTDSVFRSDAVNQLAVTDFEQAIVTAEKLSGATLASMLEKPKLETPSISESPWSFEHSQWDSARVDLGLIQRDDGWHLDVWRASAVLGGYVACIEEKEMIISELGRAIASFRRTPSHHGPLSILIGADPGAGKTYLARRLAEAFDFTLLRYDITQMLHRDDLLELFDSIASMQANASSDLLIFIDEINASLDSSPVYGAFLTPLEEGYYVRRGSRVSIRPCVWLFAGTGNDARPDDRREKLSDFESRMSLVRRIDYGSLKKGGKADKRLQDQARLEQVYLGATLVHRYFPDVTMISEAVLRAFHSIDPSTSPARKIRRMCASLKDVQYGTVSKRNCDAWNDVEFEERIPRNLVRINF